MKKKKKYVRFRHKIARIIIMSLIKPILNIKYHYSYKKFKDIKNRPYLVLFNHQTGFDQFFVSVAFSKHLYTVATEDIFSMGFVSKIIKYLVHPIAFRKSTNDSRAVIECLKIAKEGGSIALSPEGNRTYSGRTCNIKASIAKLCQKIALPIAFFNISGGYGVKPRFADKIRKGKVRGEVVKVLEVDEIMNMSVEELNRQINHYLYVDESKSDQIVKSKHMAEYLERVVYVCPKCGLSEFRSNKDEIRCLNCGLHTKYKGNNEFEANSLFKFKNVFEWYSYQEAYINNLDLKELIDLIYEDDVLLSEVIVFKKKKKIDKKAKIKLFNNRIEIENKINNFVFMFDDISTISVLGKNKLNIYYQDKIYQLKGNKQMNALKYMNIYFRYVNLEKEENDANSEFLGI